MNNKDILILKAIALDLLRFAWEITIAILILSGCLWAIGRFVDFACEHIPMGASLGLFMFVCVSALFGSIYLCRR